MSSQSRTISYEFVQRELAFQLNRIGPLGIIVWNGVPPNDSVFEEHCIVVERWVAESGPLSVFLNVAGDFVPSAAQRRIVASYSDPMALPNIRRIAILTNSAAVRGALLVLTWLARSKTIEPRGFAPPDPRAALEWLDEAVSIDIEAAIAACARANERFRAAKAAAG